MYPIFEISVHSSCIIFFSKLTYLRISFFIPFPKILEMFTLYSLLPKCRVFPIVSFERVSKIYKNLIILKNRNRLKTSKKVCVTWKTWASRRSKHWKTMVFHHGFVNPTFHNYCLVKSLLKSGSC